MHIADSPADPNTDNTSVRTDRGSPPRTPRWVYVFGIIAIVLIVMVVVHLLLDGGHGPGHHLLLSRVIALGRQR